MIHWFGDSLNGLKHWHVEARSMRELYNKLIFQGIIPNIKDEPMFVNEKLSDKEWCEYISSKNVNAYYQTFEYADKGPLKFDEDGKIIPLNKSIFISLEKRKNLLKSNNNCILC